MNSYPNPDDCLNDLGDKVVDALGASIAAAREDLTAYRIDYPAWVAESSERGLANWIHDRVFAHLIRLLFDVPGVEIIDVGSTRELIVGVQFRLRVKRHDLSGTVSTYPTQTVLEFYAQGDDLVLDGMELTHLIAGYVWQPQTREIGGAVLSMRDGAKNIIWVHSLAEPGSAAGGVVVPIEEMPTPPMIDQGGPSLPEIEVVGDDEQTEGGAAT